MTYFSHIHVSSFLLLLFLFVLSPSTSHGNSNWPESLSGSNGFNDLGKAIAKEPGFPSSRTDVEKARYVYSRLPEIAKKYGLAAGSGGQVSDKVIGFWRIAGSDPEGADSLKHWPNWGNCGEWTYAFSEILGGAGVQNKPAFADKEGGTGHSAGFTGTDTTLFVEERTAGDAISRRVFDAFRAAYHGTNSQPDSSSVAEWGDLPLTENDRLRRDATKNTWQDQIGGVKEKPFIKDASSETVLPPHKPIAEQEREREKSRQRAEEARRKAEEEARRKAEEEARRKAQIQEAIKKASELASAARQAVQQAEDALSAARGAAESGKTAKHEATSAASNAKGVTGSVQSVQAACASVPPIENIDSAIQGSWNVAQRAKELSETARLYSNNACRISADAQNTQNADARRVWQKEAIFLANAIKAKAGALAGEIAQARKNVQQASQLSAARKKAQQQANQAITKLSAAINQLGAVKQKINTAEQTVDQARGQVDTVNSAISRSESLKAAALGTLSPYSSEPDVKSLMGEISLLTPPSRDKAAQVSKSLDSSFAALAGGKTSVSEAHNALQAKIDILSPCAGMDSGEGNIQAALAAIEGANSLLSPIQNYKEIAAECANAIAKPKDTASGGYDPRQDPNLQGGSKPPVDPNIGDQFQTQQPGVKPPGRDAGSGSSVAQQPESYTKPPGSDTSPCRTDADCRQEEVCMNGGCVPSGYPPYVPDGSPQDDRYPGKDWTSWATRPPKPSQQQTQPQTTVQPQKPPVGGAGGEKQGGGVDTRTVTCSTTTKSGADTPATVTVKVGKSSGIAKFSYNMYTVKDRMIVQYGGQTLLNTGCVSGSKTVPLSLSGGSDEVTVIVQPACEKKGTKWDFRLECPK